MQLRRPLVFISALVVVASCHQPTPTSPPNSPTAPARLPDRLPFTFTRPASGTPPTPEQVTAFTHKITGFYKQVDYFRWATRLAHGLDASYDPKMPDYTMWWGQVEADKSGDTVTFKHTGTDDNMTIEMGKLFNGVAAGYLATHDPAMRKLVIGLSKGYAAFVMSLRWGDDAPGEYLWARAVFNHNHSYVTDDGRKVTVDYDPVKNVAMDWNAHTVPNETNPFWGSIWVRNIRSQDDIPHIYRIVPWLMRLVQDGGDPEVTAAAHEALSYLEGFANDVASHGYVMRSKENGQVFIPEGDLVSFSYYDTLIPNGQCNAKLNTSLIAQLGPFGNDCGNGIVPDFEQVATSSHYYNYPIIRYFHIAAVGNALVNGEFDIAKQLLHGLATRADQMATDPMRPTNAEWDPDMASTLLAAAATGLPLTADEAQLIQAQYSAAVDAYAAWPYWDLWSSSVPDGAYPYTPDHSAPGGMQIVTIQEMTYFLEYCQSPWKNPASVDPVDCSVVLDESKWGG